MTDLRTAAQAVLDHMPNHHNGTYCLVEEELRQALDHPVSTDGIDALLDIRHEEDDSWSVSIKAMPGHVGASETLEGAFAEASDAALAWIEAARDTTMEKARG